MAHRPEPDLRHWLDLVAVGTIADLVPLREENRILTRLGLRVLNRRRRLGFAALWQLVGVEPDTEIGAREVAWKLAPRLNAPGRLGDARPALELILAKTQERAAECADQLEEANMARREAQDVAYAEALTMLDANPPGACVVVAGRGWEPGVVGIVAARLVDLFERPAFVIAIEDGNRDGEENDNDDNHKDTKPDARGSARTDGQINVYQALATASPLLKRFGGHAAAAGLSLDQANIDELRVALCAAVSAQLESSRQGPTLADAEICIGELTLDLATELERLRPFGKGNRELSLVARNLVVLESRTVGSDHSHLKLVLATSDDESCGNSPAAKTIEIGAIGFGLGSLAPKPGERIDVEFSPLINRWRGKTSVEMQIRTFEVVKVVEENLSAETDLMTTNSPTASRLGS